MGGNLSNYNFGGGGVNLVKDPLQLGDSEATQLQNAELVPDEASGGHGALTMRGGLVALNASALAGSVLGMFGWALKTTYTRTIYAGKMTEDANSFMTSTNGTTWIDHLTAEDIVGQDKFADESNSLDARRMVAFQSALLYAGDDYTKGTDNPFVVIWDGTTGLTVATVPPGPSGNGSPPFAIVDMLVANGKVYVAVHDQGGAAPNLAGRVLALDLTTGSLKQVASGFGAGTGEMAGGAPACLAWYQDQLWVGLNTGNTTDAIGKIVRAYPDIDTTWTSDVANLRQSIATLAVFKGDLYAGTRSSVSAGATITKRSATTGTWATQVTSASGAGGSGHYAHLLIDGADAAYCVEYFSGVTDVVHILRSTDGTTWSTDRDVDSVDGVDATNPQLPGGGLIFDSAVYYVFRATGAALTDGFIMRRASGSWTKVATDNFGGPIGVLVVRS